MQPDYADWPLYGLAADVRPTLADALAGGEGSVMTTLYAAEGATPLGLGAQMLFAGWARAGFLSGGCVEGDVALQAEKTARDGAPRWLVYGRGGPPDIRLLCGSRIECLCERIAPASPAARRLVTLAAERRPALWLSNGLEQACLAPGEGPEAAPSSLIEAYCAALAEPAPAGAAGGAIFRRFDPRGRLVVVGADPIALAICRFAADLGLEVSLVRPKGPETPPPVLTEAYLRSDPDAAFAEIGVDAWTAVAVASHDIETDHAALLAALASPAAYVGVLGSRRRIPERLGRLRADGLDEEQLMRLQAPMGLEIGARAPLEIAVSVLAEIVQAFRARQDRRPWVGAASGADESRRVAGS